MAAGRKIVFFLGAGASLAVGAYARVQAGRKLVIPIRETFWPTFLRLCGSSDRGRRIQSFLFRYFLGYSRVPARLGTIERRTMLGPIDVEEVFTFLSERVNAPSTAPALRRAARRVWADLVEEIGRVFSRFGSNAKTRRSYKRFVARHVRSHDAVVSFNWDTVFESSLPSNRRWRYEEIDSDTHGIRILKPHGSVNWELQLGRIRRRASPLHPVVVAPTHLKFVPHRHEGTVEPLPGYLDQARQIERVWGSMEQHMRAAKALVFVGYSFPDSDLYFSSVLRSVLASRDSTPGVVLVNPDSADIAVRLRRRFSLERVARYFDLEQFLAANREQVEAALRPSS